MKKYQNKKINFRIQSKFYFLIIIAIFSTLVFTGVESFALDSQTTIDVQKTQSTTVKKQKAIKTTKKMTIPEKNAYELAHMKETGFKYLFLKFLVSMIGVLVSIFAIFIILNIYKKIATKNKAKFDNIDYDKTLESPKDFREAINIFLDKTDK